MFKKGDKVKITRTIPVNNISTNQIDQDTIGEIVGDAGLDRYHIKIEGLEIIVSIDQYNLVILTE